MKNKIKKKNKIILWNEKIISKNSILDIENLINKSFRKELKNISFFLNLFLKGRMIRIKNNNFSKNKKEFNVKNIKIIYDGFNVITTITSISNEEFNLDNNEKIKILL